ncbi:hypothetical protein CVM52_15350 [Pseudooceanicola lipolyticus]|uniref:Calcium-binding protein n=1 Tax=Pseudooceanicola lipolyticus TaxID=2029104 RepID=A0A2M8IZ11_9RHOB|nr:calcium-binding protein [Pseudooceanicola lipolyticus]PJE35786.1 hypothetical protein CVM52_15350 [Pseudooceanicola lipolyticus]
MTDFDSLLDDLTDDLADLLDTSSPLSEITDLITWSALMQELISFTDSSTIADLHGWPKISGLSTGTFEKLLVATQRVFFSYNWEEREADLPAVEADLTRQGFASETVDFTIALLEDFIARDFSKFTDAIVDINDALGAFDSQTDLVFAVASVGGLAGSAGANRLVGNASGNVILGAGGKDTLLGRGGDDALYGGRGQDTIKAAGGQDWLYGQGGNDRLIGGGGNDRLSGGNGGDVLKGNGGRDILEGGKGNDVLTGGGGVDRFVFKSSAGADTITDFQIGTDTIKIKGADSLDEITFAPARAKVVLSFEQVQVTVEDVTLADLQDAANFLF